MIKNIRGFTLGELLLVFIILMMVGAMMLPFIKHNYRLMERTICEEHVMEIGLALYIYATEHDGDFPPTLKTLYDKEYISDKTLMDCPASRRIGTPDAPDYIYTAGLTINSDSETILLCDRSKNHPDGARNCLAINGTVYWNKS